MAMAAAVVVVVIPLTEAVVDHPIKEEITIIVHNKEAAVLRLVLRKKEVILLQIIQAKKEVILQKVTHKTFTVAQ